MAEGSAASAIAGKTVCMLRSDQPLQEQTKLNMAARDKIMKARWEIDGMKSEWKKLIEAKVNQLNLLQKNSGKKRARDASYPECRILLDHYGCVHPYKDLLMTCLVAIRADAAADRAMVLPWLECMPAGVMGCKPLKEYVSGWIASNEGVPIEDVPIEDAPIEDAPIEAEPVEDVPVKSVVITIDD